MPGRSLDDHRFEHELERIIHEAVTFFQREGIIPLPFLSRVVMHLLPAEWSVDIALSFSNGRQFSMRLHRVDTPWQNGDQGAVQIQIANGIARRYHELANSAVPSMVFAQYDPLTPLDRLTGFEEVYSEMRTTPWLEAAEEHWRQQNDPYHSRMARMAPPPIQQRYQTHDRGYVGLGNIHVQPAPVPQMAQSQALRKSFVLLMENLSEAQKQTLLHEGYIDVLSQQKNRYRIFIGSAMNIMRLTKQGVPALFNKNMLCIVPEGSLPHGDVMLCQKLGLELQELVVMNRGNNFTYSVEQIAMKHKYAANDAARIKKLLDNA